MYKPHVALTAIGGVMLAAAAVAQTTSPSTPPSPQPSAPATTAPATAKAPENNLAGQGKWRASKLMGVDIYGPDNKKVGDVTEVVFDKTGKVELVTVGVGGFLGIGSKDVAIPFDQVTWSDQPMAVAAPAPSGGAGGAMSQPPITPRAPEMYPDHGKINMSKEQLTSAPGVTYAAR